MTTTYEISCKVIVNFEEFKNLNKTEVEIVRDLCPAAIETLVIGGFSENDAIAYLVNCVHKTPTTIVSNNEIYKNLNVGFVNIQGQQFGFFDSESKVTKVA